MDNRLSKKVSRGSIVHPERHFTRHFCSFCGKRRFERFMQRCDCGCVSCKGWFCKGGCWK